MLLGWAALGFVFWPPEVLKKNAHTMVVHTAMTTMLGISSDTKHCLAGIQDPPLTNVCFLFVPRRCDILVGNGN